MPMRRTTPIGLEVRDSEIHAVQFDLANGHPRLRAATQWTIPTASSEERAAALLAALRSLALDRRFVGRRVVSALPANQVDIRPLRLRPGVTPEDQNAFRENLTLEARSSLLYSPEEAYIDYLLLGNTIEDGQQKCAVLLIAARREHVNRHLAVLRAARLDCLHIEPAAHASLRVLGDEKRVVALLDVDTDNTTVSIGREGCLLFSRTLATGTRSIIDSLAQALNVSGNEALGVLRAYGMDHRGSTGCDMAQVAQTGQIPSESMRPLLFSLASQALGKIAQEIRRSLDYFSRQRRGETVQKAFLVGTGIPADMDSYLQTELDLPVVSESGLAHLLQSLFSSVSGGTAPSEGCVARFPSVAALGLALREEV